MYMPRLSLIEGIVLDYDTFSLARAIFDKQLGVPFPSSALYRTGMALCTDPRYKLFAVLNLAYDSAKIVHRPNYTLSVDEV
jgi:hypothetical protein